MKCPDCGRELEDYPTETTEELALQPSFGRTSERMRVQLAQSALLEQKRRVLACLTGDCKPEARAP